MGITVVCTGDRNWDDAGVVDVALSDFLGQDVKYVLGDARGLDTLAREWCEKNEMEHEVFEAEWGKFGNFAGPVRNGLMLSQIPSRNSDHIVLAFHDNLKGSKGTRNCVRQALMLGFKVCLIKHDNPSGTEFTIHMLTFDTLYEEYS